MLVNFSLRIVVVAGLFLVLFFPAQMALSQRPASNQEIIEEIMMPETSEVSDEVSTQFYTITIDEFPKGVIEFPIIESFGVYGDCGRDSNNDPDFSLVKKKDCVFTVDSIRIDKKDQDRREIKTICVDKISLDETNTRNCFETITADIIDLSFSPSMGFDAGPCGGLSVAAEVTACFEAGMDLGFGFGFPVRGFAPIPLRDIEFLPVGGMILHDTGIGSIWAQQFVTLSFFSPGESVKVTFTGQKPSNMNLIVGFTESFTVDAAQCFDIDGNDMDDLDNADNENGCAAFKVQADKGLATFGDILRVSCLSKRDNCSGGPFDDPAILSASTLVSASDVTAQTNVQQAAMFPGPKSNSPDPFIDVDLTDAELQKIIKLVGDEADDIVNIPVKLIKEMVKPIDILCQISPDLKDCEMSTKVSLFQPEDGQKTIDQVIKMGITDEIDKVNFDDKIKELFPNGLNVKGALDDLGKFIDSFDIAPEGFSAVELAKRFGDIGEDITTLDAKVDTVAGDVKTDINDVITDINDFIIIPLISAEPVCMTP